MKNLAQNLVLFAIPALFTFASVAKADLKCVPYDIQKDEKLNEGVSLLIIASSPFDISGNRKKKTHATWTEVNGTQHAVRLKSVPYPKDCQGCDLTWRSKSIELNFHIDYTPSINYPGSLSATLSAGKAELGEMICTGLTW